MSFALSKRLWLTGSLHPLPTARLSSSLQRLLLRLALHTVHVPSENLYSDGDPDSNPAADASMQWRLAETAVSCVSEELCSRVLNYCNARSLKEGVSVHASLVKLGIHDNIFLNNKLLSVYVKCAGADDALLMLGRMPQRDVVSWTSVISGFVRERRYDQAFALFDQMVVCGFSPNEFTFSSVLRSCSSAAELDVGVRVHGQLIKLGFGSNPIVGSSLLDFYSKCDRFAEASKVFESMSNHDMVSWTMMISMCTDISNWSQALRMYFKMLEDGVTPNEFTFVKLFIASSFLGLKCGQLVHAHAILSGAKLNLILKTALVDMYSKCDRMKDAVKIVGMTPETDVFLWTSLICGYSNMLDVEEAVSVFLKMEEVGVHPNSFTFSAIINACSNILASELGQQFHSQVIKVGCDRDVSVGNALMDMYIKCLLEVTEAVAIFENLVSPNIISWTSLITGYAHLGYFKEASEMLLEMRLSGFFPNSVTISTVLSGCRTAEALLQVMKLHGYILKTKVDVDIAVGNSLLDVYARLGKVDVAFNILNMMPSRDIISYTCLGVAVNQIGLHEMALDIVRLMYTDGINMDGSSLASFLSSAANITAIQSGKQLHSYAVKSSLDWEISVSNGLVDMYGKCGNIRDAHKVFTKIFQPNVVSWNALISGLASNGFFSDALSSFEDMRLAGIQPDGITFLLVLYACSHGGLVDKGLEYFNYMREFCSIEPQYDHYVCLVDLLGRSGRMEEAASVIETMPYDPDALIFKTLLGSCKIHRNVILGEEMAGRALELDPRDPAIYVLLANIYEDAGKLEFSEHIRGIMRDRGLRKSPGQSWMEIRHRIYFFAAGDWSNPQIREIRAKIDSLKVEIKNLGCSYSENAAAHTHSEKLAVAFGLLNTPQTAPICIMKNIRICDDCHSFIRFVTRVIDREIVVRDGNRFHSFHRGECSCRGYW